MTAPFDLLGSASFLVDDHERTAAAIQAALGFPEPKPHWVIRERGVGIRVTFLRAGSVLENPTPIEVVDADYIDPARDPARVQPHLGRLAAGQRGRAVRIHATDIATSDIDAVVDRLVEQRRRHWTHVAPNGDRRVWVGVTPDDPGDYRRDGDGGLRFEFLPTAALRLPGAVFDAPRSTTGLRWRTYLVADIHDTLDEIAGAFDWTPEQPVETGRYGSRRATLGFRCVNSTQLRLVQPAGATADGEALRRYGPGPWSLTLAVDDLDATIDDLRRRGVPVREVTPDFDMPSRVIRVDERAIPGAVFDVVDARELASR
ncbi:MAG TPA: VOC family protein [Acidimicrobiia bacterium]|nr:VOC family protein [Acidimicrobiia bacterium]